MNRLFVLFFLPIIVLLLTFEAIADCQCALTGNDPNLIEIQGTYTLYCDSNLKRIYSCTWDQGHLFPNKNHCLSECNKYRDLYLNHERERNSEFDSLERVYKKLNIVPEWTPRAGLKNFKLSLGYGTYPNISEKEFSGKDIGELFREAALLAMIEPPYFNKLIVGAITGLMKDYCKLSIIYQFDQGLVNLTRDCPHSSRVTHFQGKNIYDVFGKMLEIDPVTFELTDIIDYPNPLDRSAKTLDFLERTGDVSKTISNYAGTRSEGIKNLNELVARVAGRYWAYVNQHLQGHSCPKDTIFNKYYGGSTQIRANSARNLESSDPESYGVAPIETKTDEK